MLSYQHGYHAGNLADVHKHSLMAWILSYMIRKDKPLSYLETHAGRGLYDLEAAPFVKTGEAETGIGIAYDWFEADHPYRKVLDRVRQIHEPSAYPGSPIVAAEILRPMDNIQLAELHPQEFAALKSNISSYGGICRQQDGWKMAMSVCPPDPRRGVLLIDPSYEIKSDYQAIPKTLSQLHRKWSVGVLVLWYPILTDERHKPLLKALNTALPQGQVHEVRFPPARAGHRMIGSGLFVVNAPYGFTEEGARVSELFQDKLSHPM